MSSPRGSSTNSIATHRNAIPIPQLLCDVSGWRSTLQLLTDVSFLPWWQFLGPPCPLHLAFRLGFSMISHPRADCMAMQTILLCCPCYCTGAFCFLGNFGFELIWISNHGAIKWSELQTKKSRCQQSAQHARRTNKIKQAASKQDLALLLYGVIGFKIHVDVVIWHMAVACVHSPLRNWLYATVLKSTRASITPGVHRFQLNPTVKKYQYLFSMYRVGVCMKLKHGLMTVISWIGRYWVAFSCMFSLHPVGIMLHCCASKGKKWVTVELV